MAGFGNSVDLEKDDKMLTNILVYGDLQRRCSIVIQCSSMHACQVSLGGYKARQAMGSESHYVLSSSPRYVMRLRADNAVQKDEQGRAVGS